VHTGAREVITMGNETAQQSSPLVVGKIVVSFPIVTASETGSLGGADRRWVKRSTGEKWPVARDTNNNIIIIIIIMVPIVISATGIIPKSLSQSLKRLNLHPNTYIQMQKVAILGTCSIVRNFLNYA
jgi:hypothetical protein